MTAQEANQKTKRRIMELIPLQYDRVMEEIEKRITSGDFTCYTNDDLYSENKEKLIQNGFKVRYTNDYDSYYKISWKDDKKGVKKNRFTFWKR
jgi:hypothetical protein